MRTSTPILALVLTLAALLAFPSPFITVRADIQNPTYWSPFGPQADTWVGTMYSDFGAMFGAFENGEVDIADWNVFVSLLPGYASNPDFTLTPELPDLGIRWLSLNFAHGFLDIPFLEARITGTPGLISQSSAAGCTAGFGRLTVTLRNLEEGSAVIVDGLDKVTSTGPQTFTVFDSADGALDGNYVLPSTTTCMLAGSYTISSSIYGGTATVSLGSADSHSATVGVNYNSPSTQKLTAAGIQIRQALYHILDKPNYIQNQVNMQGRAYCDDSFQSPVQGGATSVGSCRSAADILPNGLNWPPLRQSFLDSDKAAHPWYAGAVVSAYNLQADSIAGGSLWWGGKGALVNANSGYPGLEDLRGACEHFAAAGFAFAGLSGPDPPCLQVANALLSPTAPATLNYPHLVPGAGHVSMFARTDPQRRAYGQIYADTINAIFGTPHGGPGNGGTVEYGSPGSAITQPRYYRIGEVFFIIFADPPNRRDWGLYTGGNAITTGHLETEFTFFHSQFASSTCGGPAATFPSYQLFCDPKMDGLVDAGFFSSSLTEANNLFREADYRGLEIVDAINVFSLKQSFVGLKGWSWVGTPTPLRSSFVNQVGQGWIAGTGGNWSPLNMRARPEAQILCTAPNTPPGCTTLAKYRPGGGNPSLIRRSFAQDVERIFPLAALTVWDLDVYGNIFDFMLGGGGGAPGNPMTVGADTQLVDWMTTSHSAIFNPTEVGCVGPPEHDPAVCVTGVTTQKWTLRNDLRFHDGVQVTAADVAYSLLMFRDFVPGFTTVGLFLVSAQALDASNVLVKLQRQSPFWETFVGTFPIMPRHIMEPATISVGPLAGRPGANCGPLPNPLGPTSPCANPDLDPMTNGWMVGSNAWVCREVVGTPTRPVGTIGGSCSQNADNSRGTQEVRLGGRVKLEANNDYMRGRPGHPGSSLHKISWSDFDNDGVVGFLDFAEVGINLGRPAPNYWNHPIFGSDPTRVDFAEFAQLVFYYRHGLTSPFTPASLALLDPEIDPFCSATAC